MRFSLIVFLSLPTLLVGQSIWGLGDKPILDQLATYVKTEKVKKVTISYPHSFYRQTTEERTYSSQGLPEQVLIQTKKLDNSATAPPQLISEYKTVYTYDSTGNLLQQLDSVANYHDNFREYREQTFTYTDGQKQKNFLR
ncbi:MAG: hypothetical protein AAGJ82_04765 [Bacteroidota bacterium]